MTPRPRYSGSSFCEAYGSGGLCSVQLVISDAYEGQKAAMPKVFSASLRRFRVHFISILLATAPKAHQAMVSTLDWQVFIQPDAASAQAVW